MTKRNLYKDSGVDVAKGEELVEWLKSTSASNKSKYGQVEKGIGGFAGLFRPDFSRMREPLLVSGTDGVGTKLLLGIEENNLTGIGEDLVAMCVNDLYCIGATPLFFLDYYATGKLRDDQFKTILKSIQSGLSKCQAALLGGETAEMPGLYEDGHFDLCGFVVGLVDAPQQIGPQRVVEGDELIAISSSGFHSNGYSLVRKLFADFPTTRPKYINEALVPTAIYGFLPELIAEIGPEHFHALANITGGGISGNLNRAMPTHLDASVDGHQIKVPNWMQQFLRECGVNCQDVEPAFNLGVGMVAVCSPGKSSALIAGVQSAGYDAYRIGRVVPGSGKVIFNSNIGE